MKVLTWELYYSLIFIIALSSCQVNTHEETAIKEVVDENNTTITEMVEVPDEINEYSSSYSNEETPIEISYDNTVIIKHVYVTNLEGADVKVRPNSYSECRGNFQYGEILSIIEDTNEYYGVKNRSLYSGWTKVYVLKSSTGEAKALKLKPIDLLSVSEFTDYTSTQINSASENVSIVSKYIDLELISRNVFENKRKHAVKYINNDSIENSNIGYLELKLKDTLIQFLNNPTDGESRQIHNYLGSIDALNSCLIYTEGYEYEDYFLIDKNNGEKIWISQSFPYLSIDGKYIISCRQEMYDQIGVIELYKVDGSKIELQMNAYFTKWVPTWDNMFWSSDNCFYMEVYSAYINQSDYDEELKQYIRLKIK